MPHAWQAGVQEAVTEVGQEKGRGVVSIKVFECGSICATSDT